MSDPCVFCESAQKYPRKTEKLVRDRIPEIIEASGRTPRIETLSPEAHLEALYEKLVEEHIEFIEERDLSELVDMLEVVLSIAAARGVSQAELFEKMMAKRAKNGGFAKGFYYKGLVEGD